MNNNLERPSSVFYSNDDKNVIKFNSLFLQKLEKGIFSFNLKKYEDSFIYLKNTAIIKSEEEFAELLLVIPGFDKYLIGEFLSKDKPPNRDNLILKYFMNKIDFTEIKFLDAMRFLLSRLNLPKDSALILNIIDAFATRFYNDNVKLYKDPNAIYLLASTVLALNTMFYRQNIPNMRVIQREDFIKMNEDITREISEGVYDELKMKKLDINYDCNII